MKKLLIFLTCVLLLPTIVSMNLTIESTPIENILIKGLDNSFSYNLEIKNNEKKDTFEFYNLDAFEINSEKFLEIEEGETKNLKINVTPPPRLNAPGLYIFNLYLKDSDGNKIKYEINFKIIELRNAFEIGAGEIEPESNSIEIYIKNKEEIYFENIQSELSSRFFKIEQNFSLQKKEMKTFKIQLNKDDFRELVAGFYTLKAEIETEGERAELETSINFKEKNILEETSKDYGFIVSTKIIEKTNEGNTIQRTETVIKKNIISRLFTSFSPAPNIVDRTGTAVYYTWVKELNPGDSFKIEVKTNWLFPLILIILLAVIVTLVRKIIYRDLSIRKRVQFVKTRGGEFALKVTLHLKAHKYLEKITIIDRLPALVKVHEKFGLEKPTRVNEKARRIEWNYEKLEEGEVRVLSYIIYSKVGINGKFALPSATGIYEKEGKMEECQSNKTFFIAEQSSKDFDNY